MSVLKILKKNYFMLISAFLFIYIVFNLFDGERGLLSYLKKETIHNQLIEKKNNLNTKLNDIEKKTLLLTDNLDLDYLETIYRTKFFYGKPNEHVYLVEANES